jgi:hypothetical protein
MDFNVVPRCVYTFPEIACVGLTEEDAVAQGYQVRIGRFPFSANGLATVLGERNGLVKVIAETKYGQILGVHILGPSATELISEAVLGMRLEEPPRVIGGTIHAHPTLSEALMEAMLDVNGEKIGLIEDVRYGGEWVRRLDELEATLARGSLVVGIAVALAILLVLYNTLRLTVMARRRDVEIMIRLGASDRFVATPFALEAVGQTLAAALVALGLLFALQQLAAQQVVHVAFLPPAWIAAFLGGAVLLAWAAATLALARTLRSAGP